MGGKEGKMAEKRAVNSANKEMRDKEVGGLELDEKTLMGEGTSFQAAYVFSTYPSSLTFGCDAWGREC